MNQIKPEAQETVVCQENLVCIIDDTKRMSQSEPPSVPLKICDKRDEKHPKRILTQHKQHIETEAEHAYPSALSDS